MKPYNAGIYVRLSVEDTANSAKSKKISRFQDESASVENQKVILYKYAEVNGWTVKKVYSDDGYSGGNFERPGFEEMLADIKKGVINMILVKDLSRFGRDYIEVGKYTEDVFPSLNVRFIAVMDGIDSDGNMDLLPFRSFLNDFYIRDLSKKVKSAIRVRAQNGDYIGNCTPYGYRKNSANRNRLIVDGYAAEVVKRIFDLRLSGTGCWKIASALNKDNIVNPRTYYFQSVGRENPYKCSTKWSAVTIKKILENEVYTGNSVRLKRGSLSYKNKKMILKSERDWIRAENTHEAIIDRDVWESVQKIEAHETTESKTPEPNLFHGLLRCADCGHAMYAHTEYERRNGQNYTRRLYRCCYYKRTGGSECSPHSVPEALLLQLIRDDIQKNLNSLDEQKVISEIQSKLTECEVDEVQNILQTLSVKLSQLSDMCAKLYEDRLNGIINLETFKRLSADAETERSEVQAEFDRQTVLADDAEKKIADVGRLVENMQNYLRLETIERETLTELVERIEVGQGAGRGKNRQQDVRILYRFGR